MAAVAKDPRDGRWLARWRDPGGHQHKKSFSRKVDAQRWLDQLQADRHRGHYVAPAGAKFKVGALADRWLGGLAHLKESTRERYRVAVEIHIRPTWGLWAVGDLSHSDIASWISDLVAAGLKPGTVRQTHRVLSLMLDSAVKDGLLGRNYAAGVSLPRATRHEPRFLTVDEVSSLIAHAHDEDLSIAVLAFTGLRFGELAGLKVKRVDLLRRRLVVAESMTEVGGRVVWSTPKTHQTRSVPFPRSLASSIEELTSGKGRDDLLFASPRGGVLRLRNWRRRVFDPAGDCRRHHRYQPARPEAHGGEPGHRKRSECQSSSAHVGPRFGGNDIGCLRWPLRRRSRCGRGETRCSCATNVPQPVRTAHFRANQI